MELAISETSPLQQTQGLRCTVGRLITAEEGKRIVAIAATWAGTPYALIGAGSSKGVGGDCSGSSYKIYEEAGFRYTYQTSRTITDYIRATHRFRKISGEAEEPLQPGDLIVWPGGHIAIHADFLPGDRQGVNRHNQRNNMWSAYYPGGPVYGAARAEGFRRNESFEFYRYFLMPGDPGC